MCEIPVNEWIGFPYLDIIKLLSDYVLRKDESYS